MEFLFILAGITLILLTYQEVTKKSREKAQEVSHAPVQGDKALDEKLEILNAKMDILLEYSQATSDQFKLRHVAPDMSFSRTMKKQVNKKEYEDMYAEYQQGISVTEIARKFNRGKGEVELILSLKK